MIVTEKVNLMSLGERLRSYRTLQGLTQSALSEASGVGMSDISRIETEKSPKVAAFTLQKLAKALGVTTAHLLGEVGFLQSFDRTDTQE